MLLVLVYLFIASPCRNRTLHVPELALDRILELQPVWALIYGPLYLFLILLPVFVVRQEVHIRRTFWVYRRPCGALPTFVSCVSDQSAAASRRHRRGIWSPGAPLPVSAPSRCTTAFRCSMSRTRSCRR